MTEINKKPRRFLKIVLPILILVVGIYGFKMMGKLKKAPQRQHQMQQGLLVDVMELQSIDHQTTIFATGTVQAEQEIELVPQVSGKVVSISPNFVAGGFFRKGDLLLKVEASDYQLSVEKAKAEIAQAQLGLATENERARVALKEWNRIEIDDKGTPGPLVTREIQLQQEKARLAAAQANVKQAQLNLSRTELRAPFNGRIRKEQVDIGQFIKSGASIGTLAGTDRAEIHIPVAVDELIWLTSSGQLQKGTALISLPGQVQNKWQGKLVRTLGEIDTKSRLATLVVNVNDPYRLQESNRSAVLPNGQFVNVELQGQVLKNVYKVTRNALRSNNTIWLVNNDNRLAIQPVQVIRRERDSIIIKPDVNNGARLILSALSGVAEGTLLRPATQESN
jgi:RND family efflux transporter MFP subunit